MFINVKSLSHEELFILNAKWLNYFKESDVIFFFVIPTTATKKFTLSRPFVSFCDIILF